MAFSAFKNFQEAGQAVLHYLHQKFGFDLWMITRVEGNDWIVLQSEDHGYDVKPGRVLTGQIRFAPTWCWEKRHASRRARKKFRFMRQPRLHSKSTLKLILGNL